MTTAEIEEQANLDGAATSDINLKVLLRRKVIPMFLKDVGYVTWRRVHGTASIVAGDTSFDFSTNELDHVKSIALAPDYDVPLSYIGDLPELVQAASAATTRAKPTGYWTTFNSTGFLRVRFNCPADASYTVAFTYDRVVPFSDNTSSVNLDVYIPHQHQWALVEGLRREIYERRWGIGDSRYQRADSEYKELVMRASENLEMGRGQRVYFVR